VQDYYAFGMQMPGRKLSGGYRYGFNGKENDNEVKGEGNQQDYGMRIYDGRIGKFLSVDPLTKGFPQLTPYQFASNSPIANIDLDGGEAKYYDIVLREFYDGKGMLKKTTKSTEYDKTKEAGWHLNGIIPWYTKSGRLGEGNMYSVTKVKQYAADDKGVVRIEIATIGSIYTPPPPEPNKEHPEASGSFGIQVFGSGYDPNQAPTSRANAKMHVITMNFKEFQEIMEPILVGVDAKFPSELKLPSLDDLIEHVGEYAIDKAIENLNKKWELMQKKSNEDTYCRSCAKTFKKKDGEVTWDETKAPAKDTIEVHGSNSKSNN
jgi:RHS repeat-associated protein